MKGHRAFEDLAVIERTGYHHAWGQFGEDDEKGTLNFLTKERVQAAASEVKLGQVTCLSTPLDAINPPLNADRTPFEHVVTTDRAGRDDSLNGFYLQGASQWDGLQHVRYREFGYYGGREDEALDRGELGIQVMAATGVIGRGILVDAERHFAAAGQAYRPDSRVAIGAQDLDAILAAQGTEARPGDVLLLRTGWLGWYSGLDAAGKAGLVGTLHNGPGGLECAGLDGAEDVSAWLWNHQVSAVAADNPALEVLPVDGAVGFLHRRLIPLLGMCIGEFWALDAVSAACAAANRWSFLLVSAPLPLFGGVGSPNNAYAIL
jgi:hypothetical protein